MSFLDSPKFFYALLMFSFLLCAIFLVMLNSIYYTQYCSVLCLYVFVFKIRLMHLSFILRTYRLNQNIINMIHHQP